MALSRLIVEDAGQARETPLRARPDETVAQALFRHGWLQNRPLCAGLGRCGHCRVRFAGRTPEAGADELEALPPEEIGNGWRLACRHLVGENGWRVQIDSAPSGALIPQPRCSSPEAVALDIGTTQLKWAVQCQEQVDTGGIFNPQMGAGAEVVSRLHWALNSPQDQAFLADMVWKRLGALFEVASESAAPVCLVGNPVMTGILAGWDLSPLTRPPYVLPVQDDSPVLGPPPVHVYIPPVLGSFVGPDVSAGLCALFAQNPSLAFPFLYIDLGTNAELVLAVDATHWVATSLPLGPALEGVGLDCGTVFSEQAWSRFALGPAGLSGEPAQQFPAGLSGSGVLSLLAQLKRASLLDGEGHWQAPETPWASRVAKALEMKQGELRFGLAPGVWLSSHDVEEVLKLKAIFNLGVSSLLQSAGLDFMHCRQVHLAGSISRVVAEEDLFELGFFPRFWRGRVLGHGNLALDGGLLLAQQKTWREWIAERAAQVRLVELARHTGGPHGFTRAMRFDFVVPK